MMVSMPRFQSRLFNWIDQSLPAQLGRSARKFIDQKFANLSDIVSGIEIKELPRLLGYQVAKAALYPVYLLVSTTRRVFPSLRPSSSAELEKLEQFEQKRSLKDSKDAVAGLLSDAADPDIEKEPDHLSLNSSQNLSEIPLLLRPLARLLNWVDLTKTRLDRNIAAIVKRQNHSLVTNGNADPEPNPKFLANRVFAAIWQEQVVQRQATQNALKESNSLAEVTALGENTNLEKLRRLIEAAIAYFFGEQSQVRNDSESTLESTLESENIATLNRKEPNSQLPDRPSSKRQKINAQPNQKKLPSDRRPIGFSNSPDLITETNNGSLKENAPLAESSSWERLRELIAAAMDYFIGKRSLSGDRQTSDQFSDQFPSQGSNQTLDQSLDKTLDKTLNQASDQIQQLQTGVKGFVSYLKAKQTQKSTLQKNSASNVQQINPIELNSIELNSTEQTNQTHQSDDTLKFDDQFERLQRLRQIIEAAIEYFFQKKRSPSLDATTDIEPSDSAWLTMEDVFGDDHGPWPMPVEYESVAFTQSSKYNTLHSSGDLQSFETTTTQISQDRLDGSLVFDDYKQDVLSNSPQNIDDPERDRPLRAWIEAKANLVGRRYSPVMVIVFWLDRVMLKMENLAIALWQSVNKFPKRLINLIRYGRF